ncbi:MAG: exodeoxyribonuclease III [Planctomycetota bacterium]|jgi:exodeoxyribonuclease-3
MKIISWNVNGIRACINKGFYDFLSAEDPDIICLQEVRALQEQADLARADKYQICWNPAEKRGYSGTAVFSKIKPIDIKHGLGIKKHDTEGRVITLEFKKYFLVTVYTPNSKRGLERLEYRTLEWDVDFLKYVKKLEKEKPVVFCGDLNVAHKEIDLANPDSNHKNAGFTDEERESFDNIVEAGFIDTFREFCSEGGHYTWWSNFAKSREKNIGWRIDYFCVSKALRKQLKGAAIMPEVMGSDHCPISIEISL